MVLANSLNFQSKGFCRAVAKPTIIPAAKQVPIQKGFAFLRDHVGHESDECLIWPHATSGPGYGIIKVQEGTRRRTVLAHRKMCELVHGQPPKDAQAAHECGNPRCVNPKHLRWASIRENMHDKWTHGTMVRGERIHSNKLTEGQVIAIYKDARIEREIAAAYQVSKGTVNHIRSGRSWAWLTGHQQTRRINGKWETSVSHRQTVSVGVI
jgi:hypothetical protein